MKKRLTSLVLCLFICVALLPVSAQATGTIEADMPDIPAEGDVWDGSITQPTKLVQKDGVYYYEITKCSELAYVAQIGGDWLLKNYILGNNLILNDVNFTFNQEGHLTNDDSLLVWVPIGDQQNNFMGEFDGSGYTISGLYANCPSSSFVGLIGFAGTNTQIRNVTIINSYIIGKTYVGSIAGDSTNVVSNCVNYGRVVGTDSVGGIVGAGWRVSSCENNGIVTGKSKVGGISGHGTTLSSCSNYGVVCGATTLGGISGTGSATDSANYGSITGTTMVGGVLGTGNVYSSFNLGTVSGEENIGGIAGKSEHISDCYNCGIIAGDNNCGGIVGNGGSTNYLKLKTCYNIGTIGSDSTSLTGNKGAIIGSDGALWSSAYTISNSYYLSTSNNIFGCGGIFPQQTEPEGLYSKSLEQLLCQNTYADWDFKDIWSISADKNGGYPYLQWQESMLSDIAVNNVEISETILSLAAGDYAYLTATVSPFNASKKSVTWKSSDSDIAKVSAAGKVTAISAGTAVIIATTEDGGHTANCTVTVTERMSEEYKINSITVRNSEGEVLPEVPPGNCLATVSITNQASEGNTLVFLVAYSSTGRYQEMMWVSVEDLPVGATIKVALPMDNSDGKIANLRAFTVASFSDFTPLGEAVSFLP